MKHQHTLATILILAGALLSILFDEPGYGTRSLETFGYICFLAGATLILKGRARVNNNEHT